mmetsp:Transcript_33258/g.73039  ORF Transcript_33258/g.73039 Transcript_33258/m.73039 type:complete len:219 (+) Transcript_33258:154-810(+)
MYTQSRAPRLDPMDILQYGALYDTYVVAVRKVVWESVAPHQSKSYGVVREPVAIRHIPSSLGVTLMYFYAHHYAGSVNAVKRFEKESAIVYEVWVERAQKVTEFCSFEMMGLPSQKGWGNLRIQSHGGDLKVVAGIVKIRYVLGKNPNIYQSASNIQVIYNTWLVNGATGIIRHGIQLSYPAPMYTEHTEQIKHVIRTWPTRGAAGLSTFIKNWAAPI